MGSVPLQVIPMALKWYMVLPCLAVVIRQCLLVADIVLPHWNAMSQVLDMAPHLVTFYSQEQVN